MISSTVGRFGLGRFGNGPFWYRPAASLHFLLNQGLVGQSVAGCRGQAGSGAGTNLKVGRGTCPALFCCVLALQVE